MKSGIESGPSVRWGPNKPKKDGLAQEMVPLAHRIEQNQGLGNQDQPRLEYLPPIYLQNIQVSLILSYIYDLMPAWYCYHRDLV